MQEKRKGFRMDKQTKELSQYINKNNISLSSISKNTGIPYALLYDSIKHKGRERNFRVGEYFSICEFLNINPLDITEQ